jgi:hypothetical protein
MELILSRIYPYICGIIVSGLSFYFSGFIPYYRLTNILPQTMTFGGIMIGFFSTSLTILYSIDENKKIIKTLKESNYYNLVVSYLFEAIYSGFLLSGFSALGFFMNFEVINYYDISFFCIWAFLFITSIFLSFRMIKLLGKILVSK